MDTLNTLREFRPRWQTAACWLLVSGAVTGVLASRSAADDRVPMRSSLSPRLAKAHLQGAADPHESLAMSMTLEARHRDALNALIIAQQRPGSPHYHQWLTPEAFTARFAPSARRYGALEGWLRREGFTVKAWPNRLRIDFTGRVNQVQRSFQVHMNHYDHRGRSVLANGDAAQLPASLAKTVEVVRLNTFPVAQPLVRVGTTAGMTNTMSPRDMFVAYNMRPLLDRGVDGAGQTIAVVARSDFNLSDLVAFRDQFGVSGRDPIKVFPASNPGVGAPNGTCKGIRNPRLRRECMMGEEGEVLLDAEWASAMAPGASVLVDIADTDIDASLIHIVTEHPEAKIITISFGSCERLDPSSVALFAPMYAQAAAQGQTVLVAAGDNGSDGCIDGAGPSVSSLASDANVTSIGGTALDPAFDANGTATGYVSETVWNDGDGASAGGISAIVRKPSYQNGPGVPMDGFRDQPDVSLMASPLNAGYVLIVEGQLQVVGGTSVGAPAWAGIMALVNQAAHIPASGVINEALYAFGRQQYGGNGPAVFHDITVGHNGFDGVQGFRAGRGYDLASGLGSPNVDVLAQALRARACVGDCDGDGAVTVDELLTGVNIALGSLPVSRCSSFDSNGDGEVTLDELIQATLRALNGC